MKFSKRLMVFVAVVMAFVLMGNGCEGAYAIRGAIARDTIFSLEPRANNSIVIWLVHDDLGSYCIPSSNRSLQTEAQTIFYDRAHTPEIYISYSTINAGGDGAQGLAGGLTGQGCPDESGTEHTTYVVTNICRVEDGIDQYSTCSFIPRR